MVSQNMENYSLRTSVSVNNHLELIMT